LPDYYVEHTPWWKKKQFFPNLWCSIYFFFCGIFLSFGFLKTRNIWENISFWKHLFPLYFRSFVSLSLSLFTPFVSRSSFLPCSSYALASLACASFVFVFLSPLFCLFPDLLSFLTSLSLDLPPLLVFPNLPFWSFRVSYFAKFLEFVLSFGFSQIDNQVRF
jgi:hypothetical protein